MDDSDEEYNSPNVVTPSTRTSSNEPEKAGVSGRTRSSARDRDDDDDDEEEEEEEEETNNKRGKGGAISELKGANGYAWEDEIQRSWDIVKDDEDGGRSLESIIQNMIENRKKKIMRNPTTPFQRGIIRTLIVIIDGSSTMLEKDLRPTRFSMTLTLLQEFVVEFFDQNPISQMGIVMMRNGVANLISEVSGSPQYHIDKIRQLKARQHNKYEPKGDPSLQNALEMARSLLRYNFGGGNSGNSKNSKEILLLFGALFTSDPGDIHKTIDHLVKDEIKVKVIGLSAQVSICQELVNRTNNQPKSATSKNYGVIIHETHFRELLMDCVVPLPIPTKEKAADEKAYGVPLIKMGFPSKIHPKLTMSLNNSNYHVDFPQLSASHPAPDESKAVDVKSNSTTTGSTEFDLANPNNVVGYQCPQCKNKVVNLPTVCPVCGLMLILSTHLARSYHHLVPLAPYTEVPVASSYTSHYCYGCLLMFPKGIDENAPKSSLDSMTSSRYACMKCHQHFCIDCDVFVHEALHNCPGCENTV